MDFKSLLTQISQLSEATKETPTGRIHKADPGGYGRKFDTDEEGEEKKEKKSEPEEKRGRGRPKKDGGKKYDFTAFGATGKDVKLPKHDKKKTTKHSLKEYFDQLDAALNEAEQLTIEPAKSNTQVIKQGTKTLGTVSNPQLAAQIKQSIGKGEMSLAGAQLGEETLDEKEGEKWIQKAIKHPGSFTKKAQAAGKSVSAFAKEKSHAPGTLGKQARLAQTLKKINKEDMDEGEHTQHYKPESDKDISMLSKLAGIAKKAFDKVSPSDEDLLKQLRKDTVKEADIPSDQMDMGAGLGAGRSQTTFEGKAKPDFLDLDKDGNKEEPMKKAAKDKKEVKEGAEHKLKAAHHRGKAHALAKESYNCKYDDMEEARMYHQGYKEGLDECYGMGVFETAPAATVPGMASQAMPAMEAGMEEGNAFTAALARTPKGGKFSVGGKTFTDKTNYDANLEEFAFESWDNQLNQLLTEDEVTEGMSVSVSKGQQGMPDTVSVSAQDQDAEKLLGMLRQSGMGLFGGEETSGYGAPEGTATHGDIAVVDDHDGMMSLIKKVTGSDEGSSENYADEEGHEHQEGEVCDTCGSAECECDSEEEVVDEVESYDQEEEEVAEDNMPDSDAAETTADEEAEAQEDEALAQSDEEQVTEWANDAGENAKDFDEETFKTDIDFITKAIAGGLNKEKIKVGSGGQTTIPVTAVVEDSVTDWKTLAGIR